MKFVFRFTAILFCIFWSAGALFAQTNFYNANDSLHRSYKAIRPKKPKPLSKEFSLGLRLNTDGWGVFAEKGYVKSDEKESDKFYNVRLFQVEFGEHKHPKEVKINGSGLSSGVPGDKPRPYKYGKINNFYVFKLGYGYRKLLAGKPDPGTVSIHWLYAGGVSLGLLKPYYLNVYVQSNENPRDIKYDDYPKQFLDMNSIVGRSGLMYGLGDMKYIPGLYFKTALHFDFALLPKRKLAIETGLNAELYTKKIPIMADVKAHPYFLNGYVSLQFGKRK